MIKFKFEERQIHYHSNVNRIAESLNFNQGQSKKILIQVSCDWRLERT